MHRKGHLFNKYPKTAQDYPLLKDVQLMDTFSFLGASEHWEGVCQAAETVEQ